MKKALIVLLAILVAGMLLPEQAVVPVAGATVKDWNKASFWYEPWGRSGVHKGIDIFAKQGTPVVSAVPGLVLYRGRLGMGGNVVVVLGPKWRVHYYAHLLESERGFVVWRGRELGKVGATGNAVGKPPHLHYAIMSLVPVPWRMTTQTQGWKRAFYLNPSEVLLGS